MRIQLGRRPSHHLYLPRKGRRELVEISSTWEHLDAPMWAKEGDEELYDKVEAFFGFLFTQLVYEGRGTHELVERPREGGREGGGKAELFDERVR